MEADLFPRFEAAELDSLAREILPTAQTPEVMRREMAKLRIQIENLLFLLDQRIARIAEAEHMDDARMSDVLVQLRAMHKALVTATDFQQGSLGQMRTELKRRIEQVNEFFYRTIHPQMTPMNFHLSADGRICRYLKADQQRELEPLVLSDDQLALLNSLEVVVNQNPNELFIAEMNTVRWTGVVWLQTNQGKIIALNYAQDEQGRISNLQPIYATVENPPLPKTGVLWRICRLLGIRA